MANSSYQENNVSSKRRKSFDNETGIDRISELPDVLIQHILSFLPTKEAMVTSILSKRWFWLWTSVPILHLEDSPFSAADGRLRADFVNFVARVLMLNKVASLDKFCLRFNSVYHPYNVRCWFWAMVARDVKEIDITTHPMENSRVFKLPCALFTAKSLTILKLNRGMELHVPGTVSLPSLKVLHLVWIKLTDDESASRLFSGCPVLQELLLQEIYGDNALNLNISIPSLKHLSLMFFAGYIQKLKMNAPILEYLILKDNQVSLEYDVEDVSSLLEAHVTVSSLTNTHLSLVRALYNAEFLSFNWDWYSIKTLYNFKTYPLFLNLVRLELNIGYGGWSELSRFLESSHNLEVLVLAKGANCRGLGLECHWKPPKRVPKCFLSCLKVVHFRGFEGLTYQMSIVRYILNNARVLKMMDICSSGTSDMPLVSKFNILKKLSMFPRASKACQLQFN